MRRKEEQISLMKHLYSMQKQRKKYQAKIDDLKDELKKVAKSKLKKEIKELQEDLKNEKAEKEVFKIQALTYKQTNEKAREFALIWGEALDKDFQKQLLEILKGE